MLIIKALHIIFIVTWFAGLFYIVRLFIYHAEAEEKPEPEQSILLKQYELMQHRLWYIITWPSMIFTLILGTWLLVGYFPFYLEMSFMHAKLGFILLLVVYHLWCHRILVKQKMRTSKWKSAHLRLWNELATMFLVSIVFIIVFKNQLNWITATLSFFGVAILLMILIKLYKKIRKK